jgi:hypothetical protein
MVAFCFDNLAISRGKPEVQSLVPLVGCRFEVLCTLDIGHFIPGSITVAISQNIVDFGEDVQSHVHGAE